MKVLQIPDVLYDYLIHVVQKHAGSGIHPEEGMAVAKLWEAVTKNATHIPDEQIAKMASSGTLSGQSPVSHPIHDDPINPAKAPLADDNPFARVGSTASDVWEE